MLLDVGLRGGCIAILSLLAIDAFLQRRKLVAGTATLAFDLCGIAFLIETAPGLQESRALWILPLRFASNLTSAIFLLWSEDLFADGPEVHDYRRWMPLYVMAALSLLAVLSNTQWSWHLVHAVALMPIAYGIAKVLYARTDDLIERRRADRLVFALGLGLAIAGCTIMGAIGLSALPSLSAVLGIAFAASLARLHRPAPDRPGPSSAPVEGAATTSHAPSTSPGATDELLNRLLRAFEIDRVYRDGDLTIASLARQLEAPEYRVRDLINRRLHYGNFTRFVNSYRLKDAQASLADQSQASVPILTIAFDAGFASIGPFNRAFKLQTGLTPTEYRMRALAQRRTDANS